MTADTTNELRAQDREALQHMLDGLPDDETIFTMERGALRRAIAALDEQAQGGMADGWSAALRKVADDWGVEMFAAEAFFHDALREWTRDPGKTHMWIAKEELIQQDSYGVPGSDFSICKLCGNGSGAGVLNKGIEHESTCLLYTRPTADARQETQG